MEMNEEITFRTPIRADLMRQRRKGDIMFMIDETDGHLALKVNIKTGEVLYACCHIQRGTQRLGYTVKELGLFEAVGYLLHQRGSPLTTEDIAKHLGLTIDEAFHLLQKMERLGFIHLRGIDVKRFGSHTRFPYRAQKRR
jgi:hypothetical protein